MTRKSKISRLPRQIRERLNNYLDENKEGKDLVAWLNSLPEVQAVLAADFEGKAITEQNLSDWKKTGYADWQKQQEKRALARELAEEAEELMGDAGGVELSRGLAAVLGAELAVAIREGLRDTTDPEKRWKLLLEAMAQLARLRREDHKAGQLAIKQERWNKEKGKGSWSTGKPGKLSPIVALAQRDMATKLFGGLDMPSLKAGVSLTERMLAGIEPENGYSKVESSQIQPNPGKKSEPARPEGSEPDSAGPEKAA